VRLDWADVLGTRSAELLLEYHCKSHLKPLLRGIF